MQTAYDGVSGSDAISSVMVSDNTKKTKKRKSTLSKKSKGRGKKTARGKIFQQLYDFDSKKVYLRSVNNANQVFDAKSVATSNNLKLPSAIDKDLTDIKALGIDPSLL